MPPSVLITGAGSGIGAACAQRFLAEGWNVAAVGRRPAPLERLRAGHGERVLPLAADVGTEAGVAAVVANLTAWRRELAAVVHCAGDFLIASMADTSTAEFERIWRITVWAKFALTRALLPLLAAAPPAAPRAVIHLASLAAHADFPNETAYISAMHAVIGLARAQDVELREQGIRASVVSPGLVLTPLTQRHFPPETLAAALPPGAIADSVWTLTRTIRAGGYVPEIFHQPGVPAASGAPVLHVD